MLSQEINRKSDHLHNYVLHCSNESKMPKYFEIMNCQREINTA